MMTTPLEAEGSNDDDELEEAANGEFIMVDDDHNHFLALEYNHFLQCINEKPDESVPALVSLNLSPN